MIDPSLDVCKISLFVRDDNYLLSHQR